MNHILDVSNILYRGYYGITTGDYGPSFYVLDIIETIMNSDNDCKIYLCLDGFSEKRKQLYKEYKGNREHTVSVYTQLPSLVYYLKDVNNIEILFNPKIEADDIIYTLSLNNDNKNIIYSSDNDLFQCLSENTSINTGKEYITIDNLYTFEKYVKKFFNIPVNRIVLYRAIVGDSSDNIKPVVSRFPHKIAAIIAKYIEYNDVDCPSKNDIINLKTKFESDLTENNLTKFDLIVENYGVFCNNFDIMKLNPVDDIRYNYGKESCDIIHQYVKNKIVRIRSKLGLKVVYDL